MSQVQLFKAPKQTLTLSTISPVELASMMREVSDIFFVGKVYPPIESVQLSIAQVNEMVGNNLLPLKQGPILADHLAVLAKQVPIILSEIAETLIPAASWLLEDKAPSKEELVEEIINGFADTIYTTGGYAARLGEDVDLSFGLPKICALNLGLHYYDIMEGVCGEQMSKFIKECDIGLAQALFDKKGIEVTITPGTGDWFVIKSAKDQVVDGEHYPEGKWLKGPHFQKYKLPAEIVEHFISIGDMNHRIKEIAKYFLSEQRINTLTNTLDKLNGIIVDNFGDSWKMNLTKRNKVVQVLDVLKEFYISRL